MKTIGVISYNIYCNFTNYGSALQSWALCRVIEQLGYHAKLIDYCPDVLKEANPLNPFKLMWDKDMESRRQCELSLPAIRENCMKFNRFYRERFQLTEARYTAENFNNVVAEEGIDGFICGADTIFCIDEFKGFDDGYYANYPCMKNGYSISYAASFGDAHFDEATYPILNARLKNFKALGIRENKFIEYVKDHVDVPVQRTLDPTLLLTDADYDGMALPRLIPEKYLLLYSRRFNKTMFEYADKLAEENGWKVVDISLRAENASKHMMFYHAGVEEFLSLIKHAEFLVTNSYHGMIFALQYEIPFYIFSREQCDCKIDEVLKLLGLMNRKCATEPSLHGIGCDLSSARMRLRESVSQSKAFLSRSIQGCP